MKKKHKIKWKNIFLAFALLIFIIIFIISLINIIKWLIDSKNNNNQINNIINSTKVISVKDNNNTEYVNQDEISKSDPYWYYIKYNLINVDFKKLKIKNPDTVGWIQVKGTNINYPFVQTNNNDFYLNHSFNKKYNSAGWVFMDYRNNKNDFDKNTILYAHGRLDNTMFGTLRKALNGDWLKNKSNYVIKLSTETENTLWQVFSLYRIPTTNDYLKTNFYNDNSFLEFGNMLIKRSEYNFNTKINESDKILTLSTCYNDNDKVVLHAKLIKKEKR